MDAFALLPRAKWRDIEIPLSSRSAHFDHDLIKHKLQYRDLELLEALGLHNWIFEYTVPFREDIRKGPYNHLFADTFPKFLRACRDRTVDELLDPVLGTFSARCVSLVDRSDVNRRDGDDVEVIFIQAPNADDVDQLGAPLAGIDTAISDADRIDDEVAKVSDAELAAAGLLRADLAIGPDFLDQISGFGQQLVAQGNRLNAKVANFESKLGKIEDAMDALNKQAGDPRKAPIIRSLRRLQDQVNRLGQKGAFPGRQVGSFAVPNDCPIGPLAQRLKTPLPAFMLLNPTVPKPLVPAGTVVQYLAA